MTHAARYPVLRVFFCLVALALTLGAIGAAWWWMGRPVAMPAAPVAAGEKLHCVSYAPFRGSQTPLDPSTHIEPWQFDEDLAHLSRISNCVRTYSVQHGLDKVAESARRHGMKVMQGLWLSSNAEKNRQEIATVIALAKTFPDVIQSIVVGNEVLLRGELAAPDLAGIIREVKAQTGMPVTYADVWEFWLRHREIHDAVDFVTIHILPYWEDDPVAATAAADHVASIRRRVAAAFPDKEILIGETGWPSAGRMREGALPSLSNQALVLHEILALAKRENFRVNVIEAFDQPWKRALEGTVGGYWGLLDAASRDFKFLWNTPVSDHPHWMWQAGGGGVLALLIFLVAGWARRGEDASEDTTRWFAIAINAAIAGIFIGLAIELAPVESLGTGSWIRAVAQIVVAVAAPLLGSVALMRGIALPNFHRVLAGGKERDDPLSLALGLSCIAVTVLTLQVALGLDFDPRYRDFPYAPLSAAIVPLFILSLLCGRHGTRGVAELAAAAILTLSAGYIALNEGWSNWQSLWTCALCVLLAVTLTRVRIAQS